MKLLIVNLSSDFKIVNVFSHYNSERAERVTTEKYVHGHWNPPCEGTVRDKTNL